MPRRHRVLRRSRALLRAEPADVRAGFVAHLLATGTGLLAGLILGGITDTLGDLPGLLVLVPAAVGLRGNVFGALGSRLGTLVATGDFRLTRRSETPVGQNLLAAGSLSLGVSLVLAVVAKAVAEAFSVGEAIGIGEFVVVSVIGAIIPTVVVMAITLGVAAAGVRREWDVDNVSVPVVTAAGDVVTLPSLFLATYLVHDIPRAVPVATAVLCAVAGTVGLVAALRTHLPVLRRVVAESLPFLVVAGIVSTLAGITIQSRLDTFDRNPALLILVPPLLSLSGSLAGILSARIATKLHLGVVVPSRFTLRPVGDDVALVFAVAFPIFVVLGIGADLLAALGDLASPGVLEMVALVVAAGVLATAASCVVAYFSALVTYRLGWDPDNNGVPLVSSASDFLGAASLIVCLGILGFS